MQQVHHEVKTERKNAKVSPIAVGLTGILIGAASVAAIALSDEETRKRATKKAKSLKEDLKKWSNKTINSIQNRKEHMKAGSKDMVETPKSKVSKEVKEHLDETDR